MYYELWDSESGNLVGDYASEADALAALRAIIADYGHEWVRGWELVRGSGEADHETVAMGEALIARAHAERDSLRSL